MTALSRAGVLAAVLVGGACANTTGFVITGNAIIEYDEAVQAIHVKMGQKLKTGEVTPEQYDLWAAFLAESQRIYPAAGRAWQLGLAANDVITTGHAWAELVPLAAEVVKWGILVGVHYSNGFANADGGAP